MGMRAGDPTPSLSIEMVAGVARPRAGSATLSPLPSRPVPCQRQCAALRPRRVYLLRLFPRRRPTLLQF